MIKLRFRTIVLATLVVIATLISLFVQGIIGIEATILNPNFYSNIMEKHNLYDLPQNYVLISIKNQSNDLLSEPVSKALTPTISNAFSSDWAMYQSDKIISATINYIKGNQEELELQIPIKDRKVILHGEITNFLEKQYTQEDLLNFKIESTEEVATTIVENTNIPDSVNMLEALNFSQKGFNKIVEELRYYYSFVDLIPYLIFILICGLIIYLGRSKGLIWLGYGVLFSSFIVLILVSVFGILADEFIIDNITNQSELLLTIGINPLILANIFKNSLINNINKIAIGFALLGIIITLSGNYWAKLIRQRNLNIKTKSL